MLAQDESAADWRVLYVEGEADTLVRPDEIVLLFFIESSGFDIDSARDNNESKLDRLMGLAKRMKIADADIRMDAMEIEPNDMVDGGEGTDFNPRAFRNNPDEPELREYFTYRNVVVTLRDFSKYTDFLAEALALDIELSRSAVYRFSRIDEVRQALSIRAIRDARVKADRIAGEVGMRVDDPIRVDNTYDEGSSSYGYGSSYGSSSYGGASVEEGMRMPTAPDMLYFSSTVSITYQMMGND